MKLNRYGIFIILLFIAACSTDDDAISQNEEGQISGLPIIWKRSLHKNGVWNSNSIISQANPIFDQSVIIATTEGVENRWINLIDIETGEDIWKWNDVYQPNTERIRLKGFYSHNNILHYIVGSRHYWINLADGTTYNKIRRSVSFGEQIHGIDDRYFIAGTPTDTLSQYNTEVVYEGDFQTGELTRTVVPNFLFEHETGGRIGHVTSVVPIKHEQTDYLLISWQDLFPNWHFVTYLQLYDNTEKKWAYDKIVLNEASQKGVIFQPLMVVDNKVYIQVETSILCHDIWNGEQIWKQQFPHDFSFSGFIVEEGMLVGNCENTILYGLNAETGEVLWEGQGSGTSSKLEGRFLNGVVYFSGGAPRKVFAVDINTGETLWALEADKLGRGEEWKGDIYVIPGKNGAVGKVIACTHMFAYCFEAIR